MSNTIIATSWELAQSVVSNGLITGVSWTNPTYAFLSDGLFATSLSTQGGASDFILGNFALGVPTNAVVTGFEIKILGKEGAQTVPTLTLTINAVDNTSGTNVYYPVAAYTGLTQTNAEHILGGQNSLFATSWTVDQANNIKFSFEANGDISLDSVSVRVYYYIPSSTTPVPDPIEPNCIECDSPIQVQIMSLQLPFLINQIKFYLKKGSFSYADGTPVQPGDMGTCGGDVDFVFDQSLRSNGNSNFAENVKVPYDPTDVNTPTWTVLTSGVIEVDIKTVLNRGLKFHTPYDHDPLLMSDHDANSEVIISNSGSFYARFVRGCQAGTVFSEPIDTLQEGVSKVLPTTKLNFKGSVSVVQNGTDTEQADITITAGGGTLPPALVSTVSGTSGATPSNTITLNLPVSGLNRGALLQVCTQQTVTISSVTLNGVAMTLEASLTDVPNNLRQAQYSFLAPAVGTAVIVVTLSAVASWSAGAECFAGVNQTDFIGANNTANGSSLTPSVTLNTTVNNSLVVDGLVTALTPILYTPGAAQTSNWQQTANANIRQGGSSIEAAGLTPDAVIMSYAITQNTPWVITAVEVLGITTPSATGQASIQFEDEGVALGTPGTVDEVDFVGASVTATRVGNRVTVSVSASGTGTSLGINVAQAAHGLVLGNVIQSNGVANQFTTAQADTVNDSEAVGIVTAVIDANNFTYVSSAIQLSGAFVPVGTPGDAVFLDPSVAGGMTTTKPTAIGHVVRALGTIIASGATMYFDIAALAEEITNSSSGSSVEKKVGVGSNTDTDWFNIQYPFYSGDGASKEWCIWDFSSLGISEDTPSPSFVGLSAGEQVVNNAAYSSMFRDLDNSAGSYNMQFDTDKQVIFQIEVVTSATSANNNLGGIVLCPFGSFSADQQGGNGLSVGFVRKNTDGTWYARAGAGLGPFTEVLITLTPSTKYTLRCEYDPGNATPQARYYVNGTLVATITTNLPTAETDIIGMSFGSANGGTDRAFNVLTAPSFAVER